MFKEPSPETIANWASDPPAVTLDAQNSDEYFVTNIDSLISGHIPRDTQQAKRVIFLSDHFTIIDQQLVRLAKFRRKGQRLYRLVTKQLCLPGPWRFAVMSCYHETLNHCTNVRI